jgi:hypothetical protein
LRGRSAADAICPNETVTMAPINARDKRYGMWAPPICDKIAPNARGCPLMDGGAHRKLRAVAIRSQYLMSRIGNKIGTEAGRGRQVRFTPESGHVRCN